MTKTNSCADVTEITSSHMFEKYTAYCYSLSIYNQTTLLVQMQLSC